jgi:hypothetical protein
MEIAAVLQPDDLAALDRLCRKQGVSPADAVNDALLWYIEREGNAAGRRDGRGLLKGKGPALACRGLCARTIARLAILAF